MMTGKAKEEEATKTTCKWKKKLSNWISPTHLAFRLRHLWQYAAERLNNL
jgi:hypothetical protein